MKNKEDISITMSTENTKNFMIEDDLGKHQLIKLENEIVQVSNEKLNPRLVHSLIKNLKTETFEDALGIAWVYDAFLYPEFIINGELLQQIIKDKITDPLELVLRFLIQEELQNDITPRMFSDKVLSNKVINTKEKFNTVCEIVKSAENIQGVFDSIEEPMFRLMTNMNYRTIWNRFHKADYKVDMNLSEKSLDDEWYRIEIDYSGEIELPENIKLITTWNELKDHFYGNKDRATSNWTLMVRRNIFMLKTWDERNLSTIFPVNNNYNDVIFNLGKGIPRIKTLYDNDLCLELWNHIIKEKNQAFFQNNFKENPSRLSGNKDLAKLIESL